MNLYEVVMYAADEIEQQYRNMAIRRKTALICACICLMALEEL